MRALARYFAFLASYVTGYDVTVNVTQDPSYVGYTSMPSEKKANIVLSYKTDLYNGMSDNQKKMMMLGVLVHESMHLCFTNFRAMRQKSVVLSRKSDKDAFHEICNVVEDPAIEFFASNKVGGKMLKALSAVIKHTWKTSPDIDADIPQGQEDAFAYTQIIRALIQVGDRGMLKGKFVSSVAQETFAKVLPIFNEAVIEPNGAKRVDYCVEIYKLLEKLSREENQASQQSSDKGSKMPMPSGLGEGEEGESDPSEQDGEPTSMGQAKQNLRKKLEQQMSKGESSNDKSSDGESSDGDNEADAKNAAETKSQKGQGKPSDTKEQYNSDERPYETSFNDEDVLSKFDEDMEFNEDDFEALNSEIEQNEAQIKIEESAERVLAAKAASELPIDSGDVINVQAQNPDEDRYNTIVGWYSQKINTLTNELRKIFANDHSRTKISNHGSRVCTKRLVDGKLHSNILMSRSMPKDLDDMAVYILIDKSGSMSRSNKRGKRNDQCAAETAICLYEALRNLRIPVYITGFTTRGPKALHVHYVTWNSPQSHKYTMANFAADDCNYDYYSIAAATKILQKYPAKHKLLIVLSDGAPCNPSSGMHSMSGVDATAAAITFARKTTDVLGVAMNCFQEDVYASMYGKDYITVSTADDMFAPIAAALQRIVKSW